MLEHLSLVLSWEQDGDIMKANCHIIAVFLVFLAGYGRRGVSLA